MGWDITPQHKSGYQRAFRNTVKQITFYSLDSTRRNAKRDTECDHSHVSIFPFQYLLAKN